MGENETNLLVFSETGKAVWIKEGLPPMVNGGLAEIPRDPYTFKVDRLTLRNSEGAEITTKFGVRVVLAHGTYDREKNWLCFLDGNNVKEIVLPYNADHPEDPIQMVVACSGDQVPIATDGTTGEDVFVGMFTPSERVAYSVSTDLSVSMLRETSGNTVMDVRQNNPGGFFMFVEGIEDVSSEIKIS